MLDAVTTFSDLPAFPLTMAQAIGLRVPARLQTSPATCPENCSF
jgi:hypothetical protein